MGGVPRSRSDEPVPRPTALKIPPSVPLMKDGGATGGARWVALAKRLQEEKAVPAAQSNDVTGFLAQRTRAGARHVLEGWRPCGRRATKRSDWRVGRAGPSTSTHWPWLLAVRLSAARLRAWRVAGVTICPVRSTRNEVQFPTGTVSSSARWFARSVKEKKRADLDHGQGRIPMAPACRPFRRFTISTHCGELASVGARMGLEPTSLGMRGKSTQAR